MLLLIPSIIYFALGLIFTYYFRRSALILVIRLVFIGSEILLVIFSSLNGCRL